MKDIYKSNKDRKKDERKKKKQEEENLKEEMNESSDFVEDGEDQGSGSTEEPELDKSDDESVTSGEEEEEPSTTAKPSKSSSKSSSKSYQDEDYYNYDYEESVKQSGMDAHDNIPEWMEDIVSGIIPPRKHKNQTSSWNSLDPEEIMTDTYRIGTTTTTFFTALWNMTKAIYHSVAESWKVTSDWISILAGINKAMATVATQLGGSEGR